jgi:Zn-finger protein
MGCATFLVQKSCEDCGLIHQNRKKSLLENQFPASTKQKLEVIINKDLRTLVTKKNNRC